MKRTVLLFPKTEQVIEGSLKWVIMVTNINSIDGESWFKVVLIEQNCRGEEVGVAVGGEEVDGAVVDGAVVDGVVVDGAVVDGAVVDGAVVDGAVVDGVIVEGVSEVSVVQPIESLTRLVETAMDWFKNPNPWDW